MVPVSLRQPGDVDSGNAVAGISADLATTVADPAERFRRIQSSVQAGKDYYSEMSPSERELFFLIMQAPSMLLLPTGLISRLPAYNLAISNVPGIIQPMYWNGARMDGAYPLSIVMDGMALNITLVTYDQNVDFGIIACRRSLPLPAAGTASDRLHGRGVAGAGGCRWNQGESGEEASRGDA
jgi:diacylglycerol O-acyltransferase